MNIAFSALLILLLAFPGLLVISVFRQQRPENNRPLADDLPAAIAVAALLHACWVPLMNLISYVCFRTPEFVDISAVVALLSGQDGVPYDQAILAINDGHRPLLIAAYSLSLWIASFFLGLLLRTVPLDEWLPFLRLNTWYQLLRGQPTEAIGRRPDAIKIAAVIDKYLYVGILTEYVIDEAGMLDVIVLSAATRRVLGDDDVETGVVINSDYVVLKYSEIKNLAVTGLYDHDLPEEHANGMRDEEQHQAPQ